MIGKKSGIAAKISEMEPKALVTYCHSHSLNLRVKATTKECKLLRDVIGKVGEICILVTFSPIRARFLEEIQNGIGFENGDEHMLH